MAARTTSLPAPVGGWNARDSVADMDPKDAVQLTNWFPGTTECVLRNGYVVWATGLPGAVETIFSYAGAATDKLFGVSSGSIYDCTAGGAVGAAAVSGLTNSRFQYVNNSTAGGNFLLAVNGADKMRYYDGTTWSADGGTFTVTGVDTATWSNITLHKQRIWAIQANSLKAWYLPASAIAGAAQLFDMSAFFKWGGYLVGVETWTIDSGYGVDDQLVFISSKGEVITYKGTDPASGATWAMVGLWRIGAPIGTRCLYKYQGDVLVICQDGLMPLSGALQSSRTNPRVALSDKIQDAVSSAISTYGTNFGWQVINYPKENQIILNVPSGSGQQQQYAMNTITGSWCNYTGWSANCWEIWKDDPYFGGNTVVGKAWSGLSDAGSNISGYALQAFNYFASQGFQKRFTMIRPTFRANGIPAVFAGLALDFNQADTTSVLSYSPSSLGGVWGTALWGSAIWGAGTLSVYNSWQGANGIGESAAPIVKVLSQGIDLRWASTTVVFERGAIL